MRSSCEILVFIDLRKALSGTVTDNKFYNLWLTYDLFVPVLFNVVIFLFLFCFWFLFILLIKVLLLESFTLLPYYYTLI